MSYQYMDSLKPEAKERYLLKVGIAGLKDCPYRLPSDVWQNNPTEWPDLQYADLYHYLVDSPGPFNHQCMKAYKSLEAHKYFRAGFVQTIFHMKAGTNNFVFKADVTPSQRQNDDPHRPWVATDSTGVIIAAHCTCMAGLGEACSHVAAVLFKVETAVRLGITNRLCTEEPCRWNDFYDQSVSPAAVAEIQFYKQDTKDRIKDHGRPGRPTDVGEATPQEKQNFLKLLSSVNTLPVVLSASTDTCGPFVIRPQVQSESPNLPAPFRDWYKDEHVGKTDKELGLLVKEMKLVPFATGAIDLLDKQTIGQNSNMMWYQFRAGRISSSVAHLCLRTDQSSPSSYIIRKITQIPKTPIMCPALCYGREQESFAFKAYERSINLFHKNCKMEKTGMRIHPTHNWLSASPDALIICECHGLVVVEIKCPWSAKDRTPEDYLEDGCEYVCGGNVNRSHKYYTQVQIQMEVYGADYCDFIVYTPKGFARLPVQKEPEFLSAALIKLELFWERNIAPEILTRKLEVREKKSEAGSKKYCYCGEDRDEVMVGCDGANCPFEWVHLGCIRPKRKTTPKGKWYCKECKKGL